MVILKISKTWENRAKEESPYDVIFGKFQGHRLKELLRDTEIQELVDRGSEKMVNELDVKGKIILDAGIGPLARFSSIFSRLDAYVIAIDISRSTLESARKVLNGKKVNLIQADIMNLPFKKEIFNLSFCYGTLYHMPDGRMGVQKALKELARVTRRNDIIYFNVENYVNPINWSQMIVRKVLMVVGKNQPHHTFFNYSMLPNIIKRSNMRIVEIKTTFELWGPLIFIPTIFLRPIIKIWIVMDEKISKLSNKIHFFRFIGVGWFLIVEKYHDPD